MPERSTGRGTESAAEVEKRLHAEEEKALKPFKAEFEGLPYVGILEQLVDMQDELLKLSLEKAQLENSLEFTSDTGATQEAQEAVEKILDILEPRVKAAKAVAREKKKSS